MNRLVTKTSSARPYMTVKGFSNKKGCAAVIPLKPCVTSENSWEILCTSARLIAQLNFPVRPESFPHENNWPKLRDSFFYTKLSFSLIWQRLFRACFSTQRLI